MTDTPHDSMVIEWSDEDDAYIVSLPEWGDLVHTHGETHTEAVARGEELLAGLIASRQRHSEALPPPHIFPHA
ncbi:MAG TPA: type II toxin-antitoxin system HicB family antitoxin [Ktedonobacterales bacterium]